MHILGLIYVFLPCFECCSLSSITVVDLVKFSVPYLFKIFMYDKLTS